MARVAITCALIANTYLLSEHKKVKNILLIIALFLIIIDNQNNIKNGELILNTIT